MLVGWTLYMLHGQTVVCSLRAAQNAASKLTNSAAQTSLQLIGSSNAAFRYGASDWPIQSDWHAEGRHAGRPVGVRKRRRKRRVYLHTRLKANECDRKDAACCGDHVSVTTSKVVRSHYVTIRERRVQSGALHNSCCRCRCCRRTRRNSLDRQAPSPNTVNTHARGLPGRGLPSPTSTATSSSRRSPALAGPERVRLIRDQLRGGRVAACLAPPPLARLVACVIFRLAAWLGVGGDMGGVRRIVIPQSAVLYVLHSDPRISWRQQ